ncbi:MAG: FAD-binding oxidoreductase [Synechococcales bacterium]|nr:FAD-binding oxidoreductase [Synechococcales bacterium]
MVTTLTEQVLSKLPNGALSGLRSVDQRWSDYKSGNISTPTVVHQSTEPLERVDWDVVICGGTLGILLGAALAQQGWRVALLERGVLQGRDQEWNISRRELNVFLDLGLLTSAELERAIATEYNPARIAFHGGLEFWVKDVLNVGVDPKYLLATLKAKFLAAGGQLFEQTAFQGATVHANGVQVKAGNGFTTRLLIDAMGHFSPIAQQARQGRSPDAVCLVVGTCARGFPANNTGDLFASITPIQNHCQYFWEAFPARDGRTTYLFTYLDADPARPSLEDLFDDYLRLLPDYQRVTLDQLDIVRALFGFFPCYRQSPLQMPWNRLLAVGDSSGSQSPLSFGGFGAMIRHLERLTFGIQEALQADCLSRADLALLQPYQPNLAVTWLFQQSMSVQVDQSPSPQQINTLLSNVFEQMYQLGDPVLKPFLQDVVQFSGLTRTLMQTTRHHPATVTQVVPQVGPLALLEWMFHYANLGLYTGLNGLGCTVQPWVSRLSPAQQYVAHRWLEAWRYGSGGDYLMPTP